MVGTPWGASLQAQTATQFYVMAPNGLSLRQDNNLQSKRLAVMPFGSEVLLIDDDPGQTITIDHIQAHLAPAFFNTQKGYCFDGYLSPIPLPKKEQSAREYIAALKENHPDASYSSKDNPPDFHQGLTETLTIPVRHWHQAYYISAAVFGIPKSLGFPNPKGSKEERILQKDKENHVWSSELVITRDDDGFKSIGYGFRTEGYGSSLSITPMPNGFFKVVQIAYVD